MVVVVGVVDTAVIVDDGSGMVVVIMVCHRRTDHRVSTESQEPAERIAVPFDINRFNTHDRQLLR